MVLELIFGRGGVEHPPSTSNRVNFGKIVPKIEASNPRSQVPSRSLVPLGLSLFEKVKCNQ